MLVTRRALFHSKRMYIVAFIAVFILALQVSHSYSQAPDTPCQFTLQDDISGQQGTSPIRDTPQIVKAQTDIRVIAKTSFLPSAWIIDTDPDGANAPAKGDERYIRVLASDFSLPDGCTPAFYGLPVPSLQTLQQVADGTNSSAWLQAGYNGSGIKIGLIDTNFKGLSDVLDTWSDPQLMPHLLGFKTDDVAPQETDHGTQMLRVMEEFAPEAEFYIVRLPSTNAATTKDFADTGAAFSQAVDALLADNVKVNIIVQAVNFIMPESIDKSPFTSAIQKAVGKNVLWINSAGDIGAGYYRGVFQINNQEQDMVDVNRSENRSSLMVPINPDGKVSVTLLWRQNEKAPSDFNLYAFGEPTMGGRTDGINPFNGVFDTTTIKRDAKDPIAFRRVDIPAGIFNNMPLNGDFITLPPEGSLMDATQFQTSDGLRDNVIYLYMLERKRVFVPHNTPFELYIEGAVPADFNPYVQNSLSSVVLFPGDLPDVLTVGSFDPQTNKMAWYASRSNSYQAEQGIIKPDIVTFGDLQLPDTKDAFQGTSASTAVIGGIAALVASRAPETFDAATLNKLITEYSAQCLDDDGAAGFVGGKLVLPAPDKLPTSLDTASSPSEGCSDYPWQPDMVQNVLSKVGFNYDGPDLEITSPLQDARQSTEDLAITGTVAGSEVSSYVVELANNPGTDQTPQWDVVYPATTDSNQPSPALCQAKSVTPFTPIHNNVIRHISLTDRKAGAYLLRLTLCASDRIVARQTRAFAFKRVKAPTATLEIPSVSSQDSKTLDFTGIASAGDDFKRYVIEIAPVDATNPDDIQWKPIVPKPTAGGSLPADLCSLPPSPGGDFGNVATTQTVTTLVELPTAGYPDGNYQARLTVCLDDAAPVISPVVPFEINNIPPKPFVQITSPDGKTTLQGQVEILGRIGGKGYTHYIVELIATDGTYQVLLGPGDQPSSGEDLCAITGAGTGGTTTLIDAPGLLDTFDSQGKDGQYRLRILACSDTKTEAQQDVPIIIDNTAIEHTVALDPLLNAIKGTTQEIRGTAVAPNFESYSLAIRPAGDTTAPWQIVFPASTDTSATSTCESQAGVAPMSRVKNGILGTFDTSKFPDGKYEIRLATCAAGKDAGETVEPVVIQNAVIPDATLDIHPTIDNAVLSNAWPITGTLSSKDFEQYTIEITPKSNPTGWKVIVGPTIKSGEPYPEDLCTLDPDANAVYGRNPVDGNLLTTLQTQDYANDDYIIRVRVCADKATKLESDSSIQIDNTAPINPQLSITAPQELAIVQGPLAIIGTAAGAGYTGYVVELAAKTGNDPWKVVAGAAVDPSQPYPQDLCLAQYSRPLAAVGSGILYQVDTKTLPDDTYVFRLRLCINGATFGSPITHAVIVKNQRIVDVQKVENVAPDRINLIGTVSAPDFAQYIVQIAPDDPTVDNWQIISGPTLPTDQPAPDNLCTLSAVDGNLGSYPVQNGTLAVIYSGLFPSGNYKVRVRLCLSSGEFVDKTLPTLAIESSNTSLDEATVSTGLPLQLRNGPGYAYTLANRVVDGSTIRLLGRSDDGKWYYVSSNAGDGWVPSARILVLDKNLDPQALGVIATPPLPESALRGSFTTLDLSSCNIVLSGGTVNLNGASLHTHITQGTSVLEDGTSVVPESKLSQLVIPSGDLTQASAGSISVRVDVDGIVVANLAGDYPASCLAAATIQSAPPSPTGGDNRVAPRPSDRLAVWCNINQQSMAVWGIGDNGNGYPLASFSLQELTNAGSAGVTKSAGNLGSVSARMYSPGSFGIAWNGGEFSATGVGDFAKGVNCSFVQ